MSIIEALVLGVVQGITEFLPVSSSGHLVLLQKIFGIEESALLFDTMVHVGTLAAVCTVLWKEIWAILKKPVQPLTLYLIIATIPAVLFALLLKNRIEEAFVTGTFLGFCFLITSALLLLAEFLSKNKAKKPGEQMKWHDAAIIGVSQAIAIVPGISRSGATISGALFRRFDRDFAAKFSFLLCIPAILGALVMQLKDIAGRTVSDSISVAPIIIGTLSAAVVGFFAVKFMIKIIREKSLLGFSIYTAVLGIFILIDRFGTHFWF